MERQCDACGATFEARRAGTKFCQTPGCVNERRRERKRKQRAPSNVIVAEFGEQDGSLTAQLRADLLSAGRLDSTAGRLALALADRLEHHTEKDTGSGYAALARELSAATDRALSGARVEGPVDELRQRREAIRSSV